MTMNHIERLEHLRDVVAPFAVEKADAFDMQYYTSTSKIPDVDCKTTLCLAGWAALDPTFIKEGLRWERDGDDFYDIVFLENKSTWPTCEHLKAFFGYTSDYEHELLFLPHSYLRDSVTARAADGTVKPKLEHLQAHIDMVISFVKRQQEENDANG
jgi:hypothetical protein